MADKRISMPKLMIQGLLRPEWLLHSAGTAAQILDIHENYVYRLVNEGHLERVVIVDQKGREIGRGITYDSVAAYSKRARKTRQRTLPLGAA